MLSLAVLVFAELLLLFLAFCGLFLPHAVTKGAQLFAKGQILAVAVHDEVCLVQAQLAFFVQQALVHIAGHHLIQESGQFAINLPTEALVRSVDWCGVKSGRDVDKFAACGLHAAPGTVLTDCPILEESPVNLECRVTQVIPLGSHDLFLAEVVACDVDESLLDESGKLCLEKAKLIVYSHGDYLALGKKLGTFGYSVRKKKPVRRKK